MLRVLLVCTGNVCRSPMAEGILRKLLRERNRHHAVVVESAGTFPAEGSPASQESIEVSAEHGIDLRGHVSRPLSSRLVQRADLILTMEPEHDRRLMKEYPGSNGKTHLLTTFADPEGDPLGVPDPFGADRETYARTFALIEKSLEEALPRILERTPDPKQPDGEPAGS